MTESRHDFDDYVALAPEARMKARLQGLSEVLNASGLPLLSEDERQEQATADRAGAPVAAFHEPITAFVGKGESVINPDQITALSTELKLPRARVAEAFQRVLKRQR